MRRWYDVLQVSPEADQEVIAAAYRALAKRYHPDVSKAADSITVMKEINRAYEILRDPAARAEYDRRLLAQQVARPSAQTYNSQRSEGQAKAARTTGRERQSTRKPEGEGIGKRCKNCGHVRTRTDDEFGMAAANACPKCFLLYFKKNIRPGDDDILKECICPLLKAKFALIPSGSFMMGSPADEVDRNTDEKPLRVTISRSFYIQTTQVTQGQWKTVMGNMPFSFNDGGDDCPVENVSWIDTQAFIQKLNSHEKMDRYRLPTEAEWEYAARAGSNTAYCFGNDPGLLSEYAWYDKNSEGKTHPVGRMKPNAWGLYDMHGNVFEWVKDWYRDYPFSSVTDPEGPRSGSCGVNRGGSWGSAARHCRSANRDYNGPDDHYSVLGFRLVRTR